MEDFFKREYYTEDQTISIEFINDIFKEVKSTLSKFLFVESYYDIKIKEEQRKSRLLDEEFMSLNTSNSFSGTAFIDMIRKHSNFNYVFQNKIAYIKNMIELEDSLIKSQGKNSIIDFWIKYIDFNEIFINFDKTVEVKEILLEFNRKLSCEIHGVKSDGTIEYLNEVKSSTSFFFDLANSEKYKAIYLRSIYDIKNTLKLCKVFNDNDSSTSSEKGFILHKVEVKEKLNQIIFTTNSETKLYRIENDKVEDFLVILAEDEKKAFDSFINETSNIPKNTIIPLLDKTPFYCMEVIDYYQKKIEKLKIYGKED